MGRTIYILYLALVPLTALSQKAALTSPDQRIKVEVSWEDGLSYAVWAGGQKVIDNALLGLTLDSPFSENFTLIDQDRKEVDERYEMKWWKNKRIRNRFQEMTLQLRDDGKAPKKLNLVFRAYNDGVAFRYEFPEQENLTSFTILEDQTEFAFADDFTWWSANGERDNLGPFSINAAATFEASIHTPMVLEAGKELYLGLHEAAIYDFAHFKLKFGNRENTFQCDLQGASKGHTGTATSWRAIFIGRTPGSLIESNLMVNLNPPSKIVDTSWIRSGISMWDWRAWGFTAPDGFVYGLDTPSHKRLIDFAADNHIDFLLMDADWYGPEFSAESDPTQANQKIDIEENFRYADEKGVGIILYLNDLGAKKFGMERVLKQFNKWGAVGIKYGFMTSSGQEKVLQTRKVVELCAKYRLTVNFHDNPIPPSGDERTWPNVLTREYCHSQADAKYSYYPETVVSSAFTNMLSGPLDMCNGWYGFEGSESRPRVFRFIPGTVAAENAKLVVVFSGISVLPDAPENYSDKAAMFDFVKNLPDSFDEFKVIGGTMESHITVARRAGKDWYLGALTTREPRTLKMALDFLAPGKKYRAFIYEDAPNTHYIDNREAYQTRRLTVTPTDSIRVKLAPGGGCAIRFEQMELP